MENLDGNFCPDDDPTAAERKKDHIELAFKSQVTSSEVDQRFYYEPLLAAHPEQNSWGDFQFLGKTMRIPLWVSSMTGGTELAKTINQNLARACKDFGMGMGLGSCRSILFDDENLADFDVRKLMGDAPLFANLGIAQLEQLVEKGELWRVNNLLDKLQADGLIIHVNPLQEWLQPEGDRFKKSPIETISAYLDKVDRPTIVKEVGQGMGQESLKALLQMPLAAIDFAANGGTNFAKLELERSDAMRREIYSQLALVGHSAENMVEMVNKFQYLSNKIKCPEIIISGGVQTFLDGYYLINKCKMPSIYGQASAFLKHARGSYDELTEYVNAQVQGLELAKAFLKIK
ncbi:MAG: isopentenyl-diphosphate delta-isomerase [Paraglaciecola sp.]|jgi:isopentenyl-diphosphate delta-isomerase